MKSEQITPKAGSKQVYEWPPFFFIKSMVHLSTVARQSFHARREQIKSVVEAYGGLFVTNGQKNVHYLQ